MIAVVAGVGSAIVMHLINPLRDAAYPLSVASQAIPIVVVHLRARVRRRHPPKLAIVALICFFPITRPAHGRRFVEARATPADEVRRLAPPDAALGRAVLVPRFPVQRLKVAATVSVIGAVFGERPGADEGLGEVGPARADPAPDAVRPRRDCDPHADGRGAVRPGRAL